MFATGRKTVEKEQDIIIITAMSTLKILRNLIHSKKKEDIPRAVVCTLKSPQYTGHNVTCQGDDC